ncbi:hypothetical protein [Dermatobacter hominis]|uniref:hypothetical protein n=1 Tax=Dermatobacter hominis TaxID=2884263 RepID=UPI001D10D516|nr:hypothetical protein [Dermatobacter hominis]UDY35585.1 hypothetical protein LH044_19915 [Dermatobacter hominis]
MADVLRPGRVARAAVLGALYAFVAAAFLPGSMVPDSLDMCWQAMSGEYNDWHAPVITWLWGIHFVAPVWLFLATLAATIVAIHLIISRWLRPWASVVATSLIVLFPGTLGWLGHIGKDQWFAAACLLGIALLGRASTEQRRRARRALLVGAAVCLWLAIAARKNAVLPVAVVVLVGWPVPASLFGKFRGVGWARRIVTSVSVVVLLLLSVTLLDSLVVQPEAVHAEQSTYMFDLAGISLDEHEMLFPKGTFPRGTTLEDVDQYFDPRAGDAYFFAPGTPVDPFKPPGQVARLRTAWLDAVLEHPDDYLRTRLTYTWALLGGSGPHPLRSINDEGSRPETWDSPCPLPERTYPALHEDVFDALDWFEERNVFRGWTFLLVLVAASAVAGLRKVLEARCLLAAGVLSLVGLAVAGISPTYRYSWFTALAALVAVALALRRIPALAARSPGGDGAEVPEGGPPDDDGPAPPTAAEASPADGAASAGDAEGERDVVPVTAGAAVVDAAAVVDGPAEGDRVAGPAALDPGPEPAGEPPVAPVRRSRGRRRRRGGG